MVILVIHIINFMQLVLYVTIAGMRYFGMLDILVISNV